MTPKEGGSADTVPDTSLHRSRLLLPSDMNGPPFFLKLLGAEPQPLLRLYPAGYPCQDLIGFFMAHTYGTYDRRKKEAPQPRTTH